MREANLDMEVSWAHRALFLRVHWDSVMNTIFICGHGCVALHRTCFCIIQRPVCLNKAVSTHSPEPGGGQKSGSPHGNVLCPQADPFQKLGHIHPKSPAELRRIQLDFQSWIKVTMVIATVFLTVKKMETIYQCHQPMQTMQFTCSGVPWSPRNSLPPVMTWN